jgi:CMP-N,N'-diacetyllegionaminic acid synthase
MSIVAVIPARGGSKGIPRKNLAQIAGKPLIAYTIEAARKATSLDRVLVSTDDGEIANAARNLGVEAPFLRPPALADDTTPMLAVLEHALTWLEFQGVSIEALVLLQPTSPLRRAEHIDEAVALFRTSSATSVVSVVEVPHQFNPVSVMSISNGLLQPFLGQDALIKRRQDKPRVFARNGPAVLVCQPVTLKRGDLYGQCCVPYMMSEQDSIDIDEPHDLNAAEAAILAANDLRSGHAC